jgi:hypothetical protein
MEDEKFWQKVTKMADFNGFLIYDPGKNPGPTMEILGGTCATQ